MSLTLQEANALLTSTTNPIDTPAKLLDLIRQVDVRGSGSITLLFSGYVTSGTPPIHSGAVAEAMAAADPQFRHIGGTDAAQFLAYDNNEPFRQKLLQLFPGSNLADETSPARRFLDGSVDASESRLKGPGSICLSLH